MKEQGPATRRGGIVSWLAEEVPDPAKLAARTAGEAMTAPAITVGPDAHVAYAARLMTENGIKRLPVVDSHGTLVDRHSCGRIVRAFARPDQEIEREIREDVMRRILWLEDPRASSCASSEARPGSPGGSTGARMPSSSSSSLLSEFRVSLRCTRRSGGAGTIGRRRGGAAAAGQR